MSATVLLGRMSQRGFTYVEAGRMRISRRVIDVALVGLTIGLGAPEAMGDLAVDSWSLEVMARDGVSPGTFLSDVSLSPPVSPFNTSRTATDGGSSNTTIYDFVWDAGGGSFNWDFEHQRAGGLNSAAGSLSLNSFDPVSNGIHLSITNVDMLYDFSGAYALTGSQQITGFVSLVDLADSTKLFDWSEQSISSPDESFVVGQGGGDNLDSVFGSQSGTLLAGHQYHLSYLFGVAPIPAADSGATALGDFHFNISSSAPVVPAPGAALLAMMGLPLIAMFKRRYL